MYNSDEEINNEKSSKSKVNVPNNHLTVGYITSSEDDIKIIPKRQKKVKQTSLVDYTPDSLRSENKIEEFTCYIRHNHILQKLIFDKDYANIERLLECIKILKKALSK